MASTACFSACSRPCRIIPSPQQPFQQAHTNRTRPLIACAFPALLRTSALRAGNRPGTLGFPSGNPFTLFPPCTPAVCPPRPSLSHTPRPGVQNLLDITTWESFHPEPHLHVPGAIGSLSTEAISLGSIPAIAVTRRLVVVSNLWDLPIRFKWDLDQLAHEAGCIDGVLEVQPPSGRLEVGERASCKLVFKSGLKAQVFQGEIRCRVEPTEDALEANAQILRGSRASGLQQLARSGETAGADTEPEEVISAHPRCPARSARHRGTADPSGLAPDRRQATAAACCCPVCSTLYDTGRGRRPQPGRSEASLVSWWLPGLSGGRGRGSSEGPGGGGGRGMARAVRRRKPRRGWGGA